MTAIYPTKYIDRYGEELTTMMNDGHILRVVVRGVEFSGPDFDSLSPVEPGLLAGSTPPSFTFQRGNLCACTIICEMPIPVVVENETQQGVLIVRLDLGEPEPNSISYEHLQLELVLSDGTFKSSAKHGLFEEALGQIQSQLPEGIYIKCCLNCAFSDYSPYGQGLFGCLACFRDNKDQYRCVNNKHALFSLWDTMTGYVQETYLCPEFERRVPGTGYRG